MFHVLERGYGQQAMFTPASARWRAHRDRRKFDSMVAFGAVLPRLRRRVARDLRLPRGQDRVEFEQLTERRVLALAVRLLDLGFFRIGSEDYAERNDSYGLTTMLREHVSTEEYEVIFDFPAKSGQRRVQAIADSQAFSMLAALKRRRAAAEEDRGRAGRERQVKQAIKSVAAYLGNTPAVCRASYVDPRIIDRFHAGVTIAPTIGRVGPDLAKAKVRARVESAVLELLEDAGDGG